MSEEKQTTTLQTQSKVLESETKKTKWFSKYFERYTIRDIVFLAIMASITLITSLIMPLVLSVPVFGIAHLVTGLQMALFPAIGLYKVRKIGAFVMMMIFVSLYQIAMNPILFVGNLLVAIFIELVIFAIFRGFKSTKAIFIATALYNPLTLPINFVFQNYILHDPGHWDQFIYGQEWVAWVVSFSVLAIGILGSFFGLLISKEMQKAGVFKKFYQKKIKNKRKNVKAKIEIE